MANQQDNDNGLLLVGTLYARNRRIAGSRRENVGNAVELTISTKTETKKRISRQKESAGAALDSVTIKDANEVKLGSDTFNKLTLAMALSGKSAELPTDAETVSGEVMEVDKKGVWLPLAHRNIDAASVKLTNDSSEDVDAKYITVNETLGWVKIHPDCPNVEDGDVVEADYSTRAGGGLRIEAGSENDYDLEIWLDGFNQASQKNFVLHVPSMVIAPSNEINWLADDFAKAEFSGTLVLADGNKVPYIYEEYNA